MPDPRDVLSIALHRRYRFDRELGQGGMATVYLAEDLKHHRPVAIKVLRPELSAAVGVDRFLAEIQTMANLHHPHILPLFDSGAVEGQVYYVMPYFDGESVRERLDREQQLPIADAVRIARGVATALTHAHRQGVIHRDIKPANILLQDGEPILADFGIAFALLHSREKRLTKTGLSLGTPHYMAPEQAAGERHVDERTDVYALGAVVYEMLAGEPPHTGPTVQAVLTRVLMEQPRSVSEGRPDVPAHIASAIAKALEKVPADRFESAEAFSRALDRSALEERTDAQVTFGGLSAFPYRVERQEKIFEFDSNGCAAVQSIWSGVKTTQPFDNLIIPWPVRVTAPGASEAIPVAEETPGSPFPVAYVHSATVALGSTKLVDGFIRVLGHVTPSSPPLGFVVHQRVPGAVLVSRDEAIKAYAESEFKLEYVHHLIVVPTGHLHLRIGFPDDHASVEPTPITFIGNTETVHQLETDRAKQNFRWSDRVATLDLPRPGVGLGYSICWMPPKKASDPKLG